jgi:DNA helicase II / ATP-dependent DNA helicase PcrA
MKEFVLSGAQNPKQAISYADELNKEQLQVVEEGDGPCLVLAGAGSGKTRTITYRVAYLLEKGIPADNILLLTFTNKASKEMISRVEGLLGVYPQGLWAGTFHSIANRLLRRYATHLGYESNFSILDQEDARELISLCVKELKIKKKHTRFPSSKVLLGLISFSRNKHISIERALELKHPKFVPLRGDIEAIAECYAREKKTQNSMDFDDLLLRLLDLLQDHDDIRERLSTRFQYLLVDEFQDTNVIQARIVHLLATKHQNLLVVGDDAQSIYSFRAAEIRNILDFPNRYEGAKTYKLTKNYRSTPQILSVANDVIGRNTQQFEKVLEATVSSGALPQLVPAQNTFQEAQFIAEQIEQSHRAGSSYRESAVLFRAAYHSQALEFELMKRDIPYDYRGGMKFFERAHIKDTIAHIRVLHNLRDGMAWVRALKIHPGIGLVTANKIARMAADMPNFNDLDQLVVTGKKAELGWRGFLRIHKVMKTARPYAADYIRAFSGSDEYQAYLEAEYPNYQDRLQDLEQFGVFAEGYDDLGDFLEAVVLTDEFGIKGSQESQGGQGYQGKESVEDKVILSTIHQSKGLEWDSVFVMHLAEDFFPSARALEDDQGLEEERRLFYVATTRARQNLYLTYPLTAGREYVELKQPSIFLNEIEEAGVEEVRLRAPGYGGGYGSAGGSGGGRGQRSSRGVKSSSGGWEEPTIVLDDAGETMSKEMPSSFLIDVDS